MQQNKSPRETPGGFCFVAFEDTTFEDLATVFGRRGRSRRSGGRGIVNGHICVFFFTAAATGDDQAANERPQNSYHAKTSDPAFHVCYSSHRIVRQKLSAV
jgi:hypothetical protein